MRRTDCALCGIVAIHPRQTPVLIPSIARSLAVMQSTNVGKSAQQPRDSAEGIRFKVLASGFQSHRIYDFRKDIGG